MKYNNRIKIDGDFSVASQWLGFAKNKANFLYDLSAKQGINYVKTYTPTGDVTIKVSIIQKIPSIYIRAIGGYLSGIIRYNERVLYNHDNNLNTDNVYGVKEFFPSPTSLKLGFKKEWKTTNKIYTENQSYYYETTNNYSTNTHNTNYIKYNINNKYNQQNFNIKSGNFTGLLRKYIQITLGTNFKIELQSNYQVSHGLIRNPLTKELWLIQIKSPFAEIKHDELNENPIYTENEDGGIYATRFSHKNGIIKTLKFPDITQENISNGKIIKLLSKELLSDFYYNRIPLFFECGWSFDYINGFNITNTSIQNNYNKINYGFKVDYFNFIKSCKIFNISLSFENNKPIFINKTVDFDYNWVTPVNYNQNKQMDYSIYAKKIIELNINTENSSNIYSIFYESKDIELNLYSFFEENNINKTVLSVLYKEKNIDLSLYYNGFGFSAGYFYENTFPNAYVNNKILSSYNFVNNKIYGVLNFKYLEYNIKNGNNSIKENIFCRLPQFVLKGDINNNTPLSYNSKILLNTNIDSMCIIPSNDRESILFYNDIELQNLTTEINNLDSNYNYNLNMLLDTGLFEDYIFLQNYNYNNNYLLNYYKEIPSEIVGNPPTFEFINENMFINLNCLKSNKLSLYVNKVLNKHINQTNLHKNKINNSIFNIAPTLYIDNASFIEYYKHDIHYNQNKIGCSLYYDCFSKKYFSKIETYFNINMFKTENIKISYLNIPLDNSNINLVKDFSKNYNFSINNDEDVFSTVSFLLQNPQKGNSGIPFHIQYYYYLNLFINTTELDESKYKYYNIVSNFSNKDKLHYNIEEFNIINNLDNINYNKTINYIIKDLQDNTYYKYEVILNSNVYYYNIYNNLKSLSIIGKPFE